MPRGDYEPADTESASSADLVVEFAGEDGRRASLRVDQLPLAGWHRPLAAALARRLGAAGTVRTSSGVRAYWSHVTRMMRYLAALPVPPAEPAALRVPHLEGFLRQRTASTGPGYAAREVRMVGTVLEQSPLRELIPAEVLEFVQRRSGRCGTPRPGYSDGELARLVAAARRDAACIRDRIDAGERLLARYLAWPDGLGADERALAVRLREAGEGCVPQQPGLAQPVPRLRLAQQLFVTWQDLAPLMVLLVSATGWNIETIKELPAEHRILDGRAVELKVIKRRRGVSRWEQTVTWEIGPPGRQLHTAGGIYLLAHRLMARSRSLSGVSRLWSIWRNGHAGGLRGPAEHRDPFAQTLWSNIGGNRWTARQQILADLPADLEATSAHAEPLVLDFNRLKTSVDVRRTRQMGGHLPSAARTNTIPVLFRHYLRGDPTVLAWASEVLAEAVADAEAAALAAHRRAAALAGGGPRVLAASQAAPAPTGTVGHHETRQEPIVVDAAWSACTDPQQHPVGGGRCETSFLDCFHCGNCVVTSEHLPRLLSLLDALTSRRSELPEPVWWSRYGPTWAAIRHDVLPKFSPQQVAAAAQEKPADTFLDLVDNPWELL
ncbi:hypothetical protein [Catellatospora sp. NPDC049133]|uniref:hypothetical protein n=1 Tax=Catellatospora sp. NPDC049133 TaxID=3155499 RepID=UPI0033FCE786